MAAKSAEARKVLRELDRELAEAGRSKGVTLECSGSIDFGANRIRFGPKAALLEVYEAPETDLKTRLKISAEVRLLEGLAARLVRQINTDVARPQSLESVKARKAARRRWDRDASGQ